MMRVMEAAEPADFREKVHIPGMRSICEMTGQPVPAGYERKDKNPYKQRKRIVKQDGRTEEILVTRPEDLAHDDWAPLWTDALPDMMRLYQEICAYVCVRIRAHEFPTVDHMVPKSVAWNKAYEWSNYRLACAKMNNFKGKFEDVADPFTIGDDWFALDLESGQLVAGEGLVTEADKELFRKTVERLKLNEKSHIELRVQHYEDYRAGVPFRILLRESPFVAREIRRQGRLNPGDE